MKKRCLLLCVVVLVIITAGVILIYNYAAPKPPSSLELLGISDLDVSDIDHIEFIQDHGGQWIWSTSDIAIIEDTLDSFRDLELTETGTLIDGYYMWIQIALKDKPKSQYPKIMFTGNGREDGWYINNFENNFKTTSAFKTVAEWEAILKQCERVQ